MFQYNLVQLEIVKIWKSGMEAPQILEIAVLVTNKDLEELQRGHWIIGGYTKAQLDALGESQQQHFRDRGLGGEFPPLEGSPGNGLFSDILMSNSTVEAVQVEIIDLLRNHCQ